MYPIKIIINIFLILGATAITVKSNISLKYEMSDIIISPPLDMRHFMCYTLNISYILTLWGLILNIIISNIKLFFSKLN